MDLELVIRLLKLVKLANYNSHEHEANSAARKACKIAEPELEKLKKELEKPGAKGGTWNDVQRSQEPAWRSTPPQWNPSARSPFDEFFRNARWTREDQQRNKDFREGSWAGFYDPSGADFGAQNPNRTGIERELLCKHCGNKRKTGFVGAPENYVCMDCQAKEYLRTEAERKKKR